MKIWLVLLSADVAMAWWFINSLLMFFRPDSTKYLPGWPKFKETDGAQATVTLSRRRIRTLGLVFAVASGMFLLAVLAPATLGLVLSHFKR
jgi:hypothetical protein